MSRYDKARWVMEDVESLLDEAIGYLEEGVHGLADHPQAEELDELLIKIRLWLLDAKVDGCQWFQRALDLEDAV